jgi:carbon dioxide concentrating mechanism protein CcmN
MTLSPVQPVSLSEFYVNGDVLIHESAIVAPGAILKAAPDSRIIIGAGACVGMGTILNAYQGVISIGAGAILGTGVLIVGHGEIGANACIGSTTTIYNASIAAETIVPSGSLIGDTSRQLTIEVAAEEIVREPSLEPEPVTDEDPWQQEPPIPEEPSIEVELEIQPPASTASEPAAPVVGKVYINQLLFTHSRNAVILTGRIKTVLHQENREEESRIRQEN